MPAMRTGVGAGSLRDVSRERGSERRDGTAATGEFRQFRKFGRKFTTGDFRLFRTYILDPRMRCEIEQPAISIIEARPRKTRRTSFGENRAQGAEKGPDARRRPKAAREPYSCTVSARPREPTKQMGLYRRPA